MWPDGRDALRLTAKVTRRARRGGRRALLSQIGRLGPGDPAFAMPGRGLQIDEPSLARRAGRLRRVARTTRGRVSQE